MTKKLDYKTSAGPMFSTSQQSYIQGQVVKKGSFHSRGSQTLVDALEPHERRGGRAVGTRVVEDTRKTQPTEWTKRGSQGITETGVELTWDCARSSAYILWLCSLVFLWDSSQWEWGHFLTLFPALGTLFILPGHLVQSWYEGMCLGDPLFYEGKQRRNRFRGEGRCGEAGRNEGWEGYGLDAMYERRINKKN